MRNFNIVVHLTGIPLETEKSPFELVRDLGMTIIDYESYPIADCIKMKVTNIPKILPDYIKIVTNYGLIEG